jgi:hypothetical protein
VHVAGSAVAAAVGVCAAKGTRARGRAPLHQAHLQRTAALQLENAHQKAARPVRDTGAMRFSVFQVSRKGGREKNEDRMGYCYTRESGLLRWPTAWAATPRARSLRSWHCKRWRRCSSARPPLLTDPLEFLHDAIIAAHHQLLRYATDRRPDRHPAPRSWPACCKAIRPIGRTAATRACTWCAAMKLVARTRDHSYSELQESLSSVVPMNDKLNRNVLFTCLGSPRQAGHRHRRATHPAKG